ncbi:MAG: hypothetical protein Q4F00_02005 [bacterium]|nr:hypothetical protein [bacterium]
MRKLCGVALSLLFLLLSVGVAEAQQDWTITPGVGAGPIKLGMSLKEIEANYHRDPKADHCIFHGRPIWIFYKEGFQVNYDAKQKAMQIYFDKPGIKTPGGVQVGDLSKSFLPEFGNGFIAHELPTAQAMPNQYLYVYRSKGIGFQIEGERIKFIFVSPAIK